MLTKELSRKHCEAHDVTEKVHGRPSKHTKELFTRLDRLYLMWLVEFRFFWRVWGPWAGPHTIVSNIFPKVWRRKIYCPSFPVVRQSGVGWDGDIEVVNYVVLPRGQDNYLSPRPLILDVTMTHECHGRSTLHPNGKIIHTLSSDDTPQSDHSLKNTTRKKIIHYKWLYADLSNPIVFIPVTVNTVGHSYDDLLILLFWHTHHETSSLTGELTEESNQFRFLHTVYFGNLMDSLWFYPVLTTHSV
jgi:hypothetical protein